MIKKELRFVGFRGFCDICDFVKSEYAKMNDEDKRIFKYYVYSRRYLKEYSCNMIWEFLNDDETEYVVTHEMLNEEALKYKM